MFDVIFPERKDQRYYNIHYLYILNIFQCLGCKISYQENLDLSKTSFKCIVDSKTFGFDFSDSSDLSNLGSLPTFKFHLKKEDLGKAIPFPPVSFYNWSNYYKLEKEINYNPLNSFNISCRQRPYAGALARRKYVQALLNKLYGEDRDRVLINIIDQEEYWREINRIELAIFVPGFCNNILDRGHLQYLGFGCCTISPNLPEVLPFNKVLIPGEHYIECKEDYTNLIDIIMTKRINSNQSKYKEIGENAKKLFQETSIPEKIGEWIGAHL
jgi:hypothetical protein